MRSNILSVAALGFAGLFATVWADTTWRVLYTNYSGNYAFLDSSGNVIQTTSATSVDAVSSDNKKTQRFSWGGDDTYVASQDHSGHFLGFDSSKQQFKDDFSQTHFDGLVKIHYAPANQSMAYLCRDSDCIGTGGSRTSDQYLWWYEDVPSA